MTDKHFHMLWRYLIEMFHVRVLIHVLLEENFGF
jgi:hypothetical protein